MKRIWVTLTCDEGFVADTLREIATRYENAVEDIGEEAMFGRYEAEHGEAEIQEYEVED